MMKIFDQIMFASTVICGMAGMWAVLVFDWMPSPKITAAVAFTALMFAANARLWQTRRDHVELS